MASLITLGCGGTASGWAGRGGCKSSIENARYWFGCDFAMQDLSATTFSSNPTLGGWLMHSTFRSSVLTGVNLERFDLFFNDLSEAVLSGANLKGTVLKYSVLDKATLNEANLEGVQFSFSSARGADFTRANLAGASFTGVDLLGASFVGANLRDAFFGPGTYIDRVDFTDADLTGAFFGVMLHSSFLVKSPIYCRTTMPDGSLNNQDC